jgi:hypothetical protein
MLDVTGWTTYWSPEQGDLITQELIKELQTGVASDAICYFSMYSFTDADVATELIELAKNPASRFLFDRSQFDGEYERSLVTQFVGPLPTNQWGIGTSSVDDEILHSKIVALLYPDGTGFTFSGSFNLSESAQEEFNVADFIWSRSRAEVFAQQVTAKLNWVQTHQPGIPPKK